MGWLKGVIRAAVVGFVARQLMRRSRSHSSRVGSTAGRNPNISKSA